MALIGCGGEQLLVSQCLAEQEQEPRRMRKALKAVRFVNLSRARPGQILFSAAKPNYMFKPTAELTRRLNQPCRRGGLTWR